MSERTIYLESIDPLEFYGVNNKKLKVITDNFPKLKIIARGDEIKAIGNDKDLDLFVEKTGLIISYLQKHNTISKEIIERIINETDENRQEQNLSDSNIIIYGHNGKIIKPRSANQQKLTEEFEKNDLLFAIGPAGSGKTYTSIALAVKSLKNKQVKRIILTRPAVEAGEQLGYLPGDLKEKLDPYLQPLYDALWDMVPLKKLTDYFEEGIIEIAPLAFMRGRTLENAIVILDEAQNATINQMKMFLTRMGTNSKFIITGDITQIDLPNKETSGLIHALNLLNGIKGISIIHFNNNDIVRHKLVKDIVNAYNKE
ncbi:MAG: PhoH family protein [Marinilabiliales bacterium]